MPRLRELNFKPDAPTWLRYSGAVVRLLPFGRYRLMNRICRDSRADFWARLRNGSQSFWFACDLRDSMAREVFFTGGYERQDSAVVRELLRPGGTFVDVGANWGYFTLLAACLVGGSGRVVSFEPDPRLFSRLQANLDRNRFAQVQPRQLAAAHEPGALQLVGFDPEAGNWGLSRLSEHGNGSGMIFQVAADRLDTMLDKEGIGAVDLVKIDIEGAEELALRGMAEGLRTGRYRRILLEGHPSLLAERNRSLSDVFQLLDEAGYRGWRIDHSSAASRRAAYARSIDPRQFLIPTCAQDPGNDPWPHYLWISPCTKAPL